MPFSVAVLCGPVLAQPAAAPAAKAEPADSAGTAQTAEGDAQKKVRRQVPDTLMFTIDELNEIKARIAGGDVTKEAREQQAGNQPLYLNSIMYYGPQDWTIWINGTPIGPNQDFQSFQVTNITPRYVELLIPLSVQGMRPVRLEPNQTFISESGIVVEGRYP
ncbi:MAG: hypothetical protein JNM81_11265 [Rhodospirillaceae bacterium]|nr:hypothetical protein [Rhodospirillaceae bacterium]